MLIEDLTSRGITPQLVDLWKAQGIQKLTPCQDVSLSSDTLWAGANVIIVAPTSAGKTFTGEVLAVEAARKLRRAIFLVPFKAIAEEKYAEFSGKYRDLGIAVVISDGDHNQYDQDIRMGNFGLAVIVYEKFAQLLVQSPGILADCKVLVVDEIQMIGDKHRGPTLELLLTHVRQEPEPPQIIGLSATLDDLGGLDQWLNAEALVCPGRPVPLWESVAWPYATQPLLNVETGDQKEGPDIADALPPQSFEPKSKTEIAYRLIASEGVEKSYLLFRTKVDDTIRTAQRLAHVLPVEPVKGTIRDRIAELEDTAVRSFLERWVDRRVAYHNAGLSLEERRLVEQLFKEGTLRFLVATSTLAAGVNTPADIVGVLDFRRWDPSLKSNIPISVAEYKNCVGRAGRFGISQEGRSYIFAGNARESNLLMSNYCQGSPSQLRSAMPNALDPKSFVLGVVARGLANTKRGISGVFGNSFAYNHYFKNSQEADRFLVTMVEAVDGLLKDQLLMEENEELIVTPLGEVAAASGLSISSFARLADLIKRGELICGETVEAIETICGFQEMNTLRPFDEDERSALLAEWIGGIPVGEIAEHYSNRYSVGHGNIRNIGSTASWILRTAEQMAEHLFPSGKGVQLKGDFAALAARCMFGVPIELVPISNLRALRRSEVLRLIDNARGDQFTSLHQILEAPPEDFVGVLSPQRLEHLKKVIESQIGEWIGRRRIGHLNRSEKVNGLRPLVQRVYDCQGEDFEQALLDLFTAAPFKLEARRFTRQRTGQPDLEIVGIKGTIVVQATTSHDGHKPINWGKARDVTTSVGFSGKSSNFVCIGRPEFHEVAVGNSNEIAYRGNPSLLLIALPALVEICLQEAEGKVNQGTLLSVLEDQRGYYDERSLQ